VARYEAIRSGRSSPGRIMPSPSPRTDASWRSMRPAALGHGGGLPDSKINALVAHVTRHLAAHQAPRSTQLIFADLGINPSLPVGGLLNQNNSLRYWGKALFTSLT